MTIWDGAGFAGSDASRGGVRVTLMDADEDGLADIITGSGAGEPGVIRVFTASTLEPFAGSNGGTTDQVTPLGDEILPDPVFVN